MDGEIYYHSVKVSTGFLYWIGWLLGRCKTPVHTAIYWKENGLYWKTELTNDPPETMQVVGVGDGYTIQMGIVPGPQGILVGSGDVDKIAKFATLYASTRLGDLNNTGCERYWYPEPQSYGGPMYDVCTSNTYAAWLLKKIGATVPTAPEGAIGWNEAPLFPGP